MILCPLRYSFRVLLSFRYRFSGMAKDSKIRLEASWEHWLAVNITGENFEISIEE